MKVSGHFSERGTALGFYPSLSSLVSRMYCSLGSDGLDWRELDCAQSILLPPRIDALVAYRFCFRPRCERQGSEAVRMSFFERVVCATRYRFE